MSGMRQGVGMVSGYVVSLLLVLPSSAWAADDVAEAAEPAAVHPTVEQIRAAIDGETDPELKTVMEEQLRLFEAGQLSAQELGLSGDARDIVGAPVSTEGILPMPVVDGGPLPPGGGTDNYLPPGARQELEALFSQGTGDPNSPTDQALREEAEKIFEKYGIDPREFGPDYEGDRENFMGGSEAFERMSPEALEHMSPEAREQMERFMSEHEGMEQPTREFETMMREYESTTQEAPQHEYDAPVHEYESSQPEYEAPAYEAPQQEYQAPEQMEHEYQQPPQP